MVGEREVVIDARPEEMESRQNKICRLGAVSDSRSLEQLQQDAPGGGDDLQEEGISPLGMKVASNFLS